MFNNRSCLFFIGLFLSSLLFADKGKDLGQIAPTAAVAGAIFIPAGMITTSIVGGQLVFSTTTGITSSGAFVTAINLRDEADLPIVRINMRELLEGYEETHTGFFSGIASAFKGFFRAPPSQPKKSGGNKKSKKIDAKASHPEVEIPVSDS